VQHSNRTNAVEEVRVAEVSAKLGGRRVSDELFETLRLELRRGSVVVAVLAQLRTEHYGYALRKALATHGLPIDENTLYPLLRRLESQGLLESQWREEDKRNKRFYRLSSEGKRVLGLLLEEWSGINSSLDRILQEAPRWTSSTAI
jgi:PadR family transcriptional regulator PadR